MSKITITCSSESRIAKIRKARSLNDLLGVINEIVAEVTRSKKIVQNLGVSLSSTSTAAAAAVDDDEEITIDRSGLKGPGITRNKRIQVKRSVPSNSKLGVKLEKFIVPSAQVLKQNSQVVQDLYSNAIELESIEALIKQTFADAKNQPMALKALTALREEIDKTIFKALTILNKLANKHVPTEMKFLNTRLVEFILDYVDPATYSDLTEIVYVAPADKDLHFSLYVCLYNLKDKTGYMYSEYYVVLTGVVDKSGFIRYYLNTLPDFKVPGKYTLGKEISTERDMLNRIKLLFSTNDIISEHERRPIPVDNDLLHQRKVHKVPGVTSAKVVKDEIVIGVTSGTPTKVNQVVITLLPLLNRIVGISPRSKSIFKWASKKTGAKTYLHFSLVPSAPTTGVVDLNKLRDLQKSLDLDDESMKRIVKALKGTL